jgi:hypothetical protein
LSDIERIPPEEAFEEIEQGEALLVCAYSDEEKCRAMKIDDALTLQDLERMMPSRDRALIFYCA